MTIVKRLKNAFSKKSNNTYPSMNGITFIHHNPGRGNIGDFLCSPRHYFTFDNPIPGLHIVGGGVFVGLAVEKLKRNRIPLDRSILWGAGQSLRNLEQAPEPVKQLPYLDWAIRDKDLVISSQRFVPCCSCLHKMLDTPLENKRTLLFLNADPKVTASKTIDTCKTIAADKNWSVIFNNCSEEEFKKALSHTDHIITNSYHGCYWGLLSGRKVTLMGYSSKFINLLDNFNLPANKLIKIGRGETKSLIVTLQEICDDSNAVQLDHAENYLHKFRAINTAFANRLIKCGAFSGYTLTSKASQ